MPVIVPFALAESEDFQSIANYPVIGWHNLVTALNVTSTTAAAGYPVANVANPSTNLKWVAGPPGSDEYVTVDTDSVEDIDYFAVARHNLRSVGATLSVEYESAPSTWTELVAEFMPASDAPLLIRLPAAPYAKLRLRIQNASEAPSIAVIYVGELLVLERKIYVGHVPIPLGRSSSIVNAVSESGEFLGRIVLSESLATKVQLNNLTPAWVRASFDPFVVAAKEAPFFFAWRPDDYPDEVGFAWLTDNPQPANALPNGMMAVSFAMTGIAS